MIRALVPLFFFLAQPFWETKLPEKWTDREIALLQSNSPWAQTVGPAPNVVVYLATATPLEEAESELRIRSKGALRELDADYLGYLSDNKAKNFVLAIGYPTLAGLGRAEEQKKLEQESVMMVGRKTYHIVGHFPPTPSDPVLRLVFPREVPATERRVVFKLYLGGLDFPDRELEFSVKDLMYRGKLAL